ncbi:hypothetical protein BT63DRAFT_212880 [Microthyrium microscopicum]|uniref:BZIP domain-containing protein n=1 Tax=Microthyrium microscopicum TaxID=703497 RepID=A0A6A6UJQ4_9PEZI|nr:hypothetical protein BT63DRAFT_212880 [Microthyrium microscopicum]
MEKIRKQNKMSDYLANLNNPQPTLDIGTDLDDSNLFTDTNFINFDFGDSSQSANLDQSETSNTGFPSWDQSTSLDFLNADFKFNSTNLLANTNSASSPNFGDLSSLPPSTPTTTSAKRKSSVIEDPNLSLEERTRFAAEEDKRRRNTAASARFRVKKKQREQALEKQAKEMTDKATKLEKRVNELEMENRWLKGLITDKEGGEGGDELTDMFNKVKDKLGDGGLEKLSEIMGVIDP